MDWSTDSLLFNFGLLIIFILIIIYYGTSTYDFWEKLGVIYMKPKWPLFGNSFNTTFSLRSVHEQQKLFYDHFKGHEFGGIFRFRTPSLMVIEPQLIETILIRDFTNFYNRATKVDTDLDPLSAHLVHLQDAEWKSLRNKLTPTFSSGKLKGMHQQLIDCSQDLVKFMNQFVDGNSFEVREVMAKFTTDVIASCAFGLNSNALNDPESEFRKIGKRVFQATFLSKLRFALRIQFPWLLKLLNWKSVPIKMETFFKDTIKQTLEFRKKHKIERHDFLHLLNDLRNQDMQLCHNKADNGEKQLIFDEKLMAANAFVFFAAGFETTASTLSSAMYELAVNQDVQEKAYQEVLKILKKYENVPSFEAIKEMSYLDQIISETLRKHAPIAETSRIVTKPYNIPGTSIVLPKGFSVIIPIYSLHHDPDHYPDPDKFIPERFADENKIKKGTYLPFGDGPRICIGLRFARVEIKVALLQILLKYKITLSKKTLSPLQYDRRSFFLIPIGGIWVNIKARNSYSHVV